MVRFLAKSLRVLLPFCWAFLLSSCAPGASMATLSGGEAGIQELSNEETGDVELVLEPLDVWGDTGATGAEQLSVNGETLYFRVREAGTFEQAWVRLGLFWHSKQSHINMPIVIAGGPPVTINRVRLSVDGNRESMKLAQNFSFTPGERMFDKELHSAVFTMTPDILSKVAAAENAYVTIVTNRGSLRVNLSVVTGRSNDVLLASAKYQFAEFYRRMQAQL